MTNKALRTRHWKEIGNLTRHEFDVESEGFLLRNVMEADLLGNKEDIEVSQYLVPFRILRRIMLLIVKEFQRSTPPPPTI